MTLLQDFARPRKKKLIQVRLTLFRTQKSKNRNEKSPLDTGRGLSGSRPRTNNLDKAILIIPSTDKMMNEISRVPGMIRKQQLHNMYSSKAQLLARSCTRESRRIEGTKRPCSLFGSLGARRMASSPTFVSKFLTFKSACWQR